ncbi:MAG: DUF6191 domain-containing protein [Jatrophihabitans sp.]
MTQWGLEGLFNPAKRHVEEEKRRLQATREEIGDSSGGHRIDLESGKVTIRKRDAPEPAKAPKRKALQAAEANKAKTAERTPAEARAAARKAASTGAKNGTSTGTAAKSGTSNDGRSSQRRKSAR